MGVRTPFISWSSCASRRFLRASGTHCREAAGVPVNRTHSALMDVDPRHLLLWIPMIVAVLGLAILLGLGLGAPPYLALLGVTIGYGTLGLWGPAAWRPWLRRRALPVWSAALLLGWLGALYALPAHPATPSVLLACTVHLSTLAALFFVHWPPEVAARRAAGMLGIFVLSALPHSLSTLGSPGFFDSVTLPLSLLVAHSALIVVLRSFSRSQQSVTEERMRSRQLYELAHRDVLTGLHNRRALEEDLAAAGAGQRLAIIDIDGLKAINDAHGHTVGDDLLRRFGQGLARRAALHGRAYRLSGDEFALLVGGEAGEAQGWVRAVALEVRAVYPQADASVGSVERRPGEGESAWLSRADHAMYDHKQRRRARGPGRGQGATLAGCSSPPTFLHRGSRGVAPADVFSHLLIRCSHFYA